jgi:hypothetical protein
MLHRSEFKYHCAECDEPLPGHPEPGEYIASGVMTYLTRDGRLTRLQDTGVKCWRCAECGETTWVYGFAIDGDGSA